ncbi:TNT domain-containing protein [Streptomyces sp. CNQ085]|uniref:TNT domain-containing protein n=1 Tax=Streptomyces sp. CNQ085 TaxID=2886944 RepID=UPI001F5071D4|nr:TNT domain-containing protein [Streptomyces sp. CNQ085]MCI0383821.1 TNT domain-containing protein [Streptomyces sp. CNQ085]
MRAALAAMALALTALLAPAPAAASPADETPTVRPAPCTGAHQGDPRLGPEHLPRPWESPAGPLLKGYQRTGGLSPEAFLAKYWKDEGPDGPAGWKYPPNDGFAEVNGEIDKHVEILEPGEDLDRFGSEYGSYLAPAGDPYAKRALPPQNLNTRDAAHPCDYHHYTVKRSFPVWQGSVAPWFEQPGGGQQIKLDPALHDPGEGRLLNVKWLLDNGYLTPTTS